MVLPARMSRVVLRNMRSCIRASVRHYDAEPGGEEIRSTTVTMLSKEDDENLYVEAYSQTGFRLSNGFRILGPCVLFPRSILHWAIAGVHELNEKSLSLFPILEPKLDILVLGIGESGAKYDKNIIKFLRQNKINVEVLPTDQACSTFNFLNAERRMVAAALIPPTYINFDNDEDMLLRGQLLDKGSFDEFEHGYGGSAMDGQPGELEPNLKLIKEHVYEPLGLHKEPKSKEEEQSQKDVGDKEDDGDKKR